MSPSSPIQRIGLVLGFAFATISFASAAGVDETRTLEDIYGPSGETFQAALGFRVFEGDNFIQPITGYGVGVDDMRIAWREYKLVEDATDCATSGACAAIVVDTAQTYTGEGAFHIRVLDSSPYGQSAPFNRNDCDRNGSYVDAVDDADCDNNGIPDVTLVVTSIPEPSGEPLVANETSAGAYEALLPYSATANAQGILFVADGGANNFEATVRYEDRWDGSASGAPCRNNANPVAQGFVTEGIQIDSVTAFLTVVSHRIVETNGDLDGYPDTNETFDLYVTVANKTSAFLSNVVVQISTADPRIDCILTTYSVIPALDPHGSPNDTRETPAPFRLHVHPAADRGGVAPAATCSAGLCSNGAGSCVTAANCQKTSVDDYSARIQVTFTGDTFDVGSQPQHVDLDLDLNSSAPVLATSTLVEGFEPSFGNFTFMNLDQNIASNSASNGARCQYNDPDYPVSNSYGDTECYLGFHAGQNPINDWHVHGTNSVDGGRAYLGNVSLHWGKHFTGNPGGDTTSLSQLDAIRTKVNVNLAARVCQNDPAADKRACNSAADCVAVGGGPCSSASPIFSFKQQISLVDSRSTGTPLDQAADRAVIQAQVVGSPVWQKLFPYANVYDVQGTDNFSNCLFDPTDDGNTEDDFFDPTDPLRRLGPSSTCFPEFVFAYLGDTDGPFRPTEIGRASDGPGLQGSLGRGTWVESKVDLARFRGRSVRLRFLITTIKVSDATTVGDLFMWNPAPWDDGWYVDDVRVTQTLGTAAPTATIDSINNSALPGCPAVPCTALTPALVFSPPSASSPGVAVQLLAGGSSADRCVNGVLLYRFFVDADASGTFSAGDTVLQDFSTASSTIALAATSTRYGVTVRCSAGGSGGCTGADTAATFAVACGPPPQVYDAQLWWTRLRFADDTTLTGPPFGESVDIVRGDLDSLLATGSFAASSPVCLADNVAFPAFTDAATPATGSGFYYLLRGQVNCNDATSYRTYSTKENPGNPGKRDTEINVCSP